ncbi:MAG: NAD(P)/FAD-dependent oxidoreductase [Christensenellales bacterium]|jgi:nitrite reductase (NADH) large subunit|nr:NAD(P)/FAD-dependent oxidoreductase [Clostridiaceae bacterium]
MSKQTIVIIGSGIAGLSAAEAARKQDPDVKIILLSEDTYLPYHRPRLPSVVMAPETIDRVFLHDQAWYDDRQFDLRLGTQVTSVDVDNQRVVLSDLSTLSYSKLILATGSESFMPPTPGNDLLGVFTLWTLDDAKAISNFIEDSKRAVVIGGGLLGLEIAYALKQRGLDTTILQRGKALLSRQLDPRASAMFEEQIARLDIKVRKEASVEEILADPKTGKVSSVRLTDGTVIATDIVLVSTGVRARVETMDGADIEIDRRFVTNNRMETNIPNVYAAGDCALMEGLWYGLWSVSTREGRVAGANAAGGNEICVIPPPPYLVNTMETRIASAGNIMAKGPDVTSQISFDETQLTYDRRNFIGDRLVGYILLGDTTPFSMLSRELQTS